MEESKEEHYLSICLCFSCSTYHVLFISLGWFVRWKACGQTTTVLFKIACSNLEYFPSWFFFKHLVKVYVVQWCSISVWNHQPNSSILQLGRIPELFYLRLDFHMINSSLSLPYMYVNIAFSGWDIVPKICGSLN